MSEQSQGPGWWQASDGKWYPPEQASAVEPTAPLEAPPPVAVGGGGAAGNNVPKIIAIVIAVVLIAGVAAFALTRNGDGDNSVQAFCDKAEELHNDIDLDQGFGDPSKVDPVVAKFGELVKAAPDEIKADMKTLDDAVHKFADAVKNDKDLTNLVTKDEADRINAAEENIEKFGAEKCGSDFLLSSSSVDDGTSDTDTDTDSSTSTRSSSSRSASSSSRPRSSGFENGQVTDAAAMRDRMIELAEQPGATDDLASPPVAQWTSEFPGLTFGRSQEAATPTVVSGLASTFSETRQVGYYEFAVKDTSGRCFGGVLEFEPDGTLTRTVDVDDTSRFCSGESIAIEAGYYP